MFSSDQALPSGIVGDITGVTAGAGLTGGGTTGTVTLNLDNTIAPTTSVTTPVVIGGTTTTSTLSLRSTSVVGTTGADIIFQTGNNGATEEKTASETEENRRDYGLPGSLPALRGCVLRDEP